MSTLEYHSPRPRIAAESPATDPSPTPGSRSTLLQAGRRPAGEAPKEKPAAAPRRHDLDALRGFAMLLGIGLHGALSFLPIPWPAQDSQQHELFGAFVAAVHGFRMPVFFAMSGFFTAMLWRRRGLRSLVHHRFQRIFLPLLLGVVTLVPAVEWVSRKGFELGPGQASSSLAELVQAPAVEVSDEPDPETGLTSLSMLAARGDADEVARLLDGGVSASARNRDGSTPLIIAALFARTEVVELLIEAGAELDAQGGDGSAALHTAAFFGRSEVVQALLQAGADASLVNGYGQTPLQTLAADWPTTAFFAGMVGVELEQEEVTAERAKIAELLVRGSEGDGAGQDGTGQDGANQVDAAVHDATRSALLVRLVHQPFFHHLWFLWFLCWLVPAFALYALLVDRFGGSGAPRALTVSPARLLWWLPITALPQFFMGRTAPVFGADTSAGLLPMAHVLAYYAIFFFFGAFYFDARDDEGRVGRWWFISLPVALLVIFPIGAGLAYAGVHSLDPGQRALSVLLQASYPWLMVFGLMGLFRRFLGGENRRLRYLSDASYWLYLSHLPLIIGGQIAIRDWQWPAAVKFSLLCLVVTALLLAIYQAAVRYSWLGRLLNGPRQRPQSQAPA